jgi:hypothetical protein
MWMDPKINPNRTRILRQPLREKEQNSAHTGLHLRIGDGDPNGSAINRSTGIAELLLLVSLSINQTYFYHRNRYICSLVLSTYFTQRTQSMLEPIADLLPKKLGFWVRTG